MAEVVYAPSSSSCQQGRNHDNDEKEEPDLRLGKEVIEWWVIVCYFGIVRGRGWVVAGIFIQEEHQMRMMETGDDDDNYNDEVWKAEHQPYYRTYVVFTKYTATWYPAITSSARRIGLWLSAVLGYSNSSVSKWNTHSNASKFWMTTKIQWRSTINEETILIQIFACEKFKSVACKFSLLKNLQ